MTRLQARATAGLLFCFLVIKLSEGGHIIDIFGVVLENEISQESDIRTDSAAEPPVLTSNARNTSGTFPQGSAERSCGCKQLILSSIGEARYNQPNALGIYKYYQPWHGQPAYYGPNGSRMYTMAGGGWLVGPTIGSPTGYIHNKDRSSLCPYEIPGGWMYFNAHAGVWYTDTTLVFR